MRAQYDSMTALSKQPPIEPMDSVRPESRARWVNAQDVNWGDSTGRRNTSMMEVCDGHAERGPRRVTPGVASRWTSPRRGG
jgi:hypothetical protein